MHVPVARSSARYPVISSKCALGLRTGSNASASDAGISKSGAACGRNTFACTACRRAVIGTRARALRTAASTCSFLSCSSMALLTLRASASARWRDLRVAMGSSSGGATAAAKGSLWAWNRRRAYGRGGSRVEVALERSGDRTRRKRSISVWQGDAEEGGSALKRRCEDGCEALKAA